MNQRGYSLIEMLTVIAIIGTLANVGVAAADKAKKDALDEDFKNDVRVLAQALELYYNDYGNYRIPEGGAIDAGVACGTPGAGNGLGFIDIKSCTNCTPPGCPQNYDTNISIVEWLKANGYIPDNQLLEDKQPPGIDAILYLCNGDGSVNSPINPQTYAIYTSLYTDDQRSVDLIDQGVTCGVWSPSAHSANYVIFSELLQGLSCAPGCCGDGPGC